MAGKIGFLAYFEEKKKEQNESVPEQKTVIPKKSLVQVSFPGRDATLAYYNDLFDLQPGDRVYVEGKLEGIQGRVTSVNYNFRIKPSDYKRVIHVVDTEVHGDFLNTGSHFVTFDKTAIPYEKVHTWFCAPGEEEEYISGSDDSSFKPDDLGAMGVTPEIAERGHRYYMESRVRYLSVDNGVGKAIVEGTENYEIEFLFRDGEICDLTCSCFCSYPCKHEFAAMLQLNETMEFILKEHAKEYGESSYFAAIDKGTLLSFALDGKPGGSITL